VMGVFTVSGGSAHGDIDWSAGISEGCSGSQTGERCVRGLTGIQKSKTWCGTEKLKAGDNQQRRRAVWLVTYPQDTEADMWANHQED